MAHMKGNEKLLIKFDRLEKKIEELERQKFHQLFPIAPKLLYAELCKHVTKIDALRKSKNRRGVLTEDQYDLLFPANGETHSDKFDTTLLHVLLRNFGGYQKPGTGWDAEPAPIDRTEIANFIRLKRGRNKMKHLSGYEKTEQTYKAIYHTLKQPFMDLGCSKVDLNDLLPTPIQYKYTPPIPEFTCRDHELKELQNELVKLENNTSLRGVVLSGFGGIGKSELAKQYFKIKANFYDNNIIWIDATLLQNSFEELAEYLELKVKDQNNHFKPIEVIIKEVHNFFENDRVLFIFDNADEEPQVTTVTQQATRQPFDEIMKYIPKSPTNFSLITSQITNWPTSFQQIQLRIISIEDALKFVLHRLQLPTASKPLEEIIECLGGGYLLGLQHFITYIQTRRVSLEDYLKLIKIQPEKLNLAGGTNIMSAINVNIERIFEESNEHSRLAQDILNKLPFLNGKEIKRGFFTVLKYGNKANELDNIHSVNEALYLLRKYSLITITESATTNPLDDTITIHSFVQKTIKTIQNSATCYHHFSELLNHFIQDGNKEFLHMERINFQEFDYWYKQLIYLFQFNVPEENEYFREEFLKFFSQHAGFFTDVLLSRSKLDVCLKILSDATDAFGIYINSIFEPQNILQKMKAKFNGSAMKRKELYRILYRLLFFYRYSIQTEREPNGTLEKIYNAQKKTFGNRDIDTLRTRLQMEWEKMKYGSNTDTDADIQSVIKLCKLQSKCLPDNHPERITSSVILASYEASENFYFGGEEFFQQILAEQTSKLTNNHPILNEIKFVYARIFWVNREEKIKISNEILQVYKEIYPLGHPCIVETQLYIAMKSITNNDIKTALLWTKRIYNELNRVYDESQSTVLQWKLTLAVLYAGYNDIENAYTHTSEILDILENSYGNIEIIDTPRLLMANLHILKDEKNDASEILSNGVWGDVEYPKVLLDLIKKEDQDENEELYSLVNASIKDLVRSVLQQFDEAPNVECYRGLDYDENVGSVRIDL